MRRDPGEYVPFGAKRFGKALLEGLTLALVFGVVGAACAIVLPILIGVLSLYITVPLAAFSAISFGSILSTFYAIVGVIPYAAPMIGAMGAGIWAAMGFFSRFLSGSRLEFTSSTPEQSTWQWAIGSFIDRPSRD
ncbi:MAG: hypothetical protein AAB573_02565 [Patescibacteria group bacterium]